MAGEITSPPTLSEDPGIIYTFPYDGQADVSPDALILASFTDAVNPGALAEPCALEGGAARGVCLVGPDGVVPVVATVGGPDDNVVQIAAAGLTPGAGYELFVGPAVLWDAATNLPASGPLIRFRTAGSRPIPGVAPSLVAINGEPPERFAADTSTASVFPFADFTTVRLVFSEPVDPRTLDGVALVAADTGEPVAAAVLSQGHRVVIDPDADLRADARYELRLGDTLRDLDGEAAAPAVYAFEPAYSGVDGRAITQGLTTTGSASVSRVSGGSANAVALSSPLIGAHSLALRDSHIEIELANPAAFGTRVPVAVRKGQTLNVEGLGVELAGLIPTDLDTDDLAVQIITDGTGYLTRNPFRDEARLPDDDLSPVYAYLTFDISIEARDAVGNAVLNQTVLNVQTTGVARVLDGGLTIEAAASMQLDLLGLTQAPSSMSLRFSTIVGDIPAPDATSPVLSASYPVSGTTGFSVDDSVLLTFSESIDARRLQQAGGITLEGDGQPIAARVDVLGSTVVITPAEPLPYATDYRVAWSGRVFDLAGNAAAEPAGDITFRTQNPQQAQLIPMLLSTVYPGVPCALRDGTATSPGRCVDGGGGDDRHALLALPANRGIEVHLSQPLARQTVTIGETCGAGSVRVESVAANGDCLGAVPGTLEVVERAILFQPDAPWQDGQRYRLTVHAGGNDTCDPDELCGLNGLPLNTDGLGGMSDDGDAGGPDAVYDFVATASSPDTYAITSTFPVADFNGNGVIDNGEEPGTTNIAGLSITGTSGIIQGASLNGPDCLADVPGHQACMHLSASLPVSLESVEDSCVIDGVDVGSCIPVRVFPQMLYGTSLSLDADAVLLGTLSDIRTEQVMIRVREPGEAPVYARIYQAPDGSGARIHVPLSLYLDAPDMRLVGGLAGHDLNSKAVDVVLEGAVTFAPDGRLFIDLHNVAAVDMSISVSALGIGVGGIDLQIPAGGMAVQLLGNPLKGGPGVRR